MDAGKYQSKTLYGCQDKNWQSLQDLLPPLLPKRVKKKEKIHLAAISVSEKRELIASVNGSLSATGARPDWYFLECCQNMMGR